MIEARILYLDADDFDALVRVTEHMANRSEARSRRVPGVDSVAEAMAWRRIVAALRRGKEHYLELFESIDAMVGPPDDAPPAGVVDP